jgi:hypothetical protein
MSESIQALSPTSGASPPPTATDNVSHFLRLHGELRNQIYAIALTFPDQTIQYVTRIVFKPSSHVEFGIANTPQTLSVTTQESIIGGPAQNQLQYVCKELYQETHWLELKFNPTLIFRSEGMDVSATEQLLHLFAMVPAEKRIWIRTVDVYSGTKSDHEARDRKNNASRLFLDSNYTLRSLADLCRYNPPVTVKYRLILFDGESVRFKEDRVKLFVYIATGTQYLGAIRRHIRRELWPRGLQHFFARYVAPSIKRTRLTSRDVAHIDVPNLRFFPMHITLTEGLFAERRQYFQDAPKTMSIVPLWQQTLRGWLTEGI